MRGFLEERWPELMALTGVGILWIAIGIVWL
jgi:hypothetical protein